jgi:Phage tail tube protein
VIRSNAYDFMVGIQAGGLGVPATNPTHFLKCLAGSDMSPATTIANQRTGEGTRASDGISFVSGVSAGGTLNVVAQYKDLPELLYLSHGAVATTGSVDPYSHAGTINQAGALPYFTIFKHVDALYEVYPDCKMEDFALDVASANRLLIAKCQITSIGETMFKVAAPATPAVAEPSTDRYNWDQAKGTWVVDGVTVAFISLFGYHVKNNLQVVLGESLTGYALQEGPSDPEISAGLQVIDLTRYLKAVYGSATPADATHIQPVIPTGSFAAKFTAVAASPGPERSYQIAATAVEYRSKTPTIVADPSGKIQELTMVGRCVGTDPKVTHTVKNGTATYGT